MIKGVKRGEQLIFYSLFFLVSRKRSWGDKCKILEWFGNVFTTCKVFGFILVV